MGGAESSMQVHITGGCQCGAVRYALSAEPAGLGLCHCRMCQKASGGPFMAFGRVPIDAVTWTRGTLSTFQSSNTAVRGFCSLCGTPLTFKWRDDAISFTLGSLDDPSAFTPESNNGVEALLPWTEHIAALPKETTIQWMAPEAQARFVDFQHPDHDT